MNNKAGISQFIQNFDYELESKAEWLDVHINLMFNEINEIQNAIYIFEVADNEWDRRLKNGEKIGYSAIRTILYESLPYRIILGLSKIFVGNKEFSLPKTVHVISQMDEYKNNQEILNVIRKIEKYLETSETIKLVIAFRDQFFAHLDKECVISDCRVDSTIAVRRLEKSEIDEGVRLIGELYEACFNRTLEYANKELSQKDIIYTFFWM